MTIESAALDQWYAVEALAHLPAGTTRHRLLGCDLDTERSADGAIRVRTSGGRVLAHRCRYGHLWVCLGAPPRDIPDIPEAGEADRRCIPCGAVDVRASGLRVVENFLDMAHFPFVHSGILGAEPETEVPDYRAEIRRDCDEVWATDCRFFQPRAALAATGGLLARYDYRVAAPFLVMLYKTSPLDPERRDVIALFVQPIEPDVARAHPMLFVIDPHSDAASLIRFQQFIFVQDRIILENQRPRLLPLEPRAEMPTRADAVSVAYRRWLKEKGLRYGTTAGPMPQGSA